MKHSIYNNAFQRTRFWPFGICVRQSANSIFSVSMCIDSVTHICISFLGNEKGGEVKNIENLIFNENHNLW